ncbi:BatA domain-containing protein [Pararhodobacter marinus]|uniref:BatA domain-containing protein n=1 Tax=Pararhodobacter marinus TaxID=2184063 RepID=UPI003515E2F0
MNALGFSAPVLLWALLALPILWWLLRAVPPAPVRRRFPGIALLLGLKDRDPESQRTPWWLLLIRIAALGALIVALAGPVLNPTRALPGQGPLVVVMDASWASARDWPRRIERATQALDEAQRAGRPVAVVTLTDPPVGALDFRAAEHWRERLPGVTPRPWSPEADLPDWVADLPEGTETLCSATVWPATGGPRCWLPCRRPARFRSSSPKRR